MKHQEVWGFFWVFLEGNVMNNTAVASLLHPMSLWAPPKGSARAGGAEEALICNIADSSRSTFTSAANMLSCQAAPSIHRTTSTSYTCWSAQLKTSISCNTCEKKHFCSPGVGGGSHSVHFPRSSMKDLWWKKMDCSSGSFSTTCQLSCSFNMWKTFGSQG